MGEISITIPKEIFEEPYNQMNVTSKLLYGLLLHLSENASNDGLFRASIRELANMINLSPKTIERAKTDLRLWGLIDYWVIKEKFETYTLFHINRV